MIIDNDVENLGVEELSNNLVEGDSSSEVGGYLEIEIDEDFEWFDNEIEKILSPFMMFCQII